MNTELQTKPTVPRRRIWPYIVATAAVAGLVSAFVCYRLWTAPNPPGTDDGSPAVALVIQILMVGFVAICAVIGGLLGWLIGYFVRVLLPLTHATRDANHAAANGGGPAR